MNEVKYFFIVISINNDVINVSMKRKIFTKKIKWTAKTKLRIFNSITFIRPRDNSDCIRNILPMTIWFYQILMQRFLWQICFSACRKNAWRTLNCFALTCLNHGKRLHWNRRSVFSAASVRSFFFSNCFKLDTPNLLMSSQNAIRYFVRFTWRWHSMDCAQPTKRVKNKSFSVLCLNFSLDAFCISRSMLLSSLHPFSVSKKMSFFLCIRRRH